jgi:hypothetical protein
MRGSAQLLPNPSSSPQGFRVCFLAVGGRRGREQERGSQGTWLAGSLTHSHRTEAGGRKGKRPLEALIKLVPSSGFL